MNNELKKAGFSLTEVLLAVGTLAIGLMFIGGTFIAGIYFSTLATERTIGAVAADEAFAKIKLYGSIDPNWVSVLPAECNDFSKFVPLNENEFAYPSTRSNPEDKQYYWSALCRRVAPDPNRLVQVTVFVCRKAGPNTRYRNPASPFDTNVSLSYPVSVKVGVEYADSPAQKNRLRIIPRLPDTSGDRRTFINDGYTIVDDRTGRLYRVLRRYPAPDDNIILLGNDWDDRDWALNPGQNLPYVVWVIPPAIGGGRNPCIAVYQEVIRF